jgi:hypothetical protein
MVLSRDGNGAHSSGLGRISRAYYQWPVKERMYIIGKPHVHVKAAIASVLLYTWHREAVKGWPK